MLLAWLRVGYSLAFPYNLWALSPPRVRWHAERNGFLCFMPDLERFGKALRELREGRGITQEQVIDRSSVYKDARNLRKIEAGEHRPKRVDIVTLLMKGFGEKNSAKIDEFLSLAGYDSLTETEVLKLGLSKQSLPAVATPPLAPRLAKMWHVLITVSGVASIGLAIRQDWMTALCCLLYAGLFAISVLLESAHEYRGKDTLRATTLAGSLILATSFAATWVDTYYISINRGEGLWYALPIFVAAAVLQWTLVRPALSANAIVRTRFQTHTAQAAHLKNTCYFLLIVAFFWLPPRHCVHVTNGQAFQTVSHGSFCPPPEWLFGIFVLMLLLSIPMGSRLLENLRPSPRHNLYVNLFYARALLYFLLSTICLVWYSIYSWQ